MSPSDAPAGGWNLELFEVIHATANSPHWAIALATAALDGPLLVALALTVWRLSRQHFWRGAWTTALAYGIERLIEAGVAAFAFHPRPFAAGYSLVWTHHAATNSMPSSHVATMLILALALLARREAGYGILVIVLAAVVAWARIYLGLHWPADVAGSVVSALVSFGVASVVQLAVARRGRGARRAPGTNTSGDGN